MSKNKNLNSLFSVVEEQYLKNDLQSTINPGNIIEVKYKFSEGEKERIQIFEGLIISVKNKNLTKTFILRRIISGIGVEQHFYINSPNIISIIPKGISRIKRAKLYFVRFLSEKALRIKLK